MKKSIITLLLIIPLGLGAQSGSVYYDQAFNELEAMLNGQIEKSFKRAVFISENAFVDNGMSYQEFSEQIGFLAHLSQLIAGQGLTNYEEKDKQEIQKNFAVYRILKDSVSFIINQSDSSNLAYVTEPFIYDFEDFFGEKDWSKMFVTKLMFTHKGNCHSLPYLYKIIAEEIGATAHLAMAPNHTYIKQWSEQTGWYNTELTSGQFPLDAWIMASGYIKLEGVQNRLYLEALNDQQSIALTLVDLAQGYQRRFGESADPAFVLKCLNTAIEYYPNYAHARILKAEHFKSEYSKLMQANGLSKVSELWDFPGGKERFEQMQAEYKAILDLGYRKMPREMYLNWLLDIQTEQTNKELEAFSFTAPQPFKDYDYEVQVATLSRGKYQEFFDQDSILQIGSVLVNRLTGEITHFVEYDAVYSEATLEPEVISKWLQQDPLAEQYYDHSPYNFVMNNPINNIDPDGREVYFLNSEDAGKVVSDLNAMFRRAYNIDYDVFNIEMKTETVTKTVEEKADFNLFNPDTWDGKVDKEVEVQEERAYIRTNNDSDFDWNSDKYSAATFDMFNTNMEFKGIIGSPTTRVGSGRFSVPLGEAKGYSFKSSNTIILSSDLHQTNGKDLSKFNSKWNFGGTALHELVNHFHPLGDQETNRGLQLRFGLPRSRITHYGKVITNWSAAERKRLQNLRSR